MSDFDVAADELLSIIERIESLEAEKKETAELISSELKSAADQGFCKKTIRKLVALRRRSDDDIAEEEAILQTYKNALGMD